MTTLRTVRTLARRLGARVEDEKSFGFHSCRVEAPKRQLWNEGDVHEMVCEVYQPWKPDYADLLSRMGHGLRDCTDPDCDWCNDN
jgi:hypothetical protein